MIRRPAVPCDVYPARSLERAGRFLLLLRMEDFTKKVLLRSYSNVIEKNGSK